jgi:hypothetical protein
MSKPITTLFDGLFQRRNEIKITRTQYGVVIGMNVSARRVKEALMRIPDEAVIIGIEDIDIPPPSCPYVKEGSVFIFEVEKTDEI